MHNIGCLSKRLARGLLVLPLAAVFITGCGGSGSGDGGSPALTGGRISSNMRGDTVIPPQVMPSGSSGKFAGRLNDDETMLEITITHDVANPTVMHFHQQEYTPDAGVETHYLGPVCGDCTIDVPDQGAAGQINFTFSIPDDEFLEALNRGRIYVDVHSADYPADAGSNPGEIGGLLWPDIFDLSGFWYVETTGGTYTETSGGVTTVEDWIESFIFDFVESESLETEYVVTVDDQECSGEDILEFDAVQTGNSGTVQGIFEVTSNCGNDQSNSGEISVEVVLDSPTSFTATVRVDGNGEDAFGNEFAYSIRGTLRGRFGGGSGEGPPVFTEGRFTAVMGGGDTVIPPPAAGEDSGSTGTFDGQLNEDEDELVYMVVHDVASPTVLHFHQQATADDMYLGPVCDDCAIDLTGLEIPGLIEDTLSLPDDDGFLDALNRGLIYVDVHSEDYPAAFAPPLSRGEIGGLLMPDLPDITGSWYVEATDATYILTVDGETMVWEDGYGWLTLDLSETESEGETVYEAILNAAEAGACAMVLNYVQTGMDVLFQGSQDREGECLLFGDQSDRRELSIQIVLDTPMHFTGSYTGGGTWVEADGVEFEWTETATLDGRLVSLP